MVARFSRRPAVASVCLLLLPASVFALPGETPVNVAGAVGSVALSYGNYTVNSQLVTAPQIDTYTFSGVAGDPVRIEATSGSPGLDESLIVRGSNGAILTTSGCSGHSNPTPVICSFVLNYTLPTSGTYTLNFSDSGSNNPGAYTLNLDRMPPVNDFLGIRYGVTNSVSLGHQGAIDYFAFNAAPGSIENVTFLSQSAGIDGEVRVWNSTGSLINTTTCSGHSNPTPVICSASASLAFSSGGTYYIGVDDVGQDNTGNFQLRLDCTFGTCPTSVPAVPEPGQAWLMLAGVVAFALWRRAGLLRV